MERRMGTADRSQPPREAAHGGRSQNPQSGHKSFSFASRAKSRILRLMKGEQEKARGNAPGNRTLPLSTALKGRQDYSDGI